MKQIDSQIYIGNLREAGRPRTYRRHGITAVLNLCKVQPTRPYPEDLTTVHQPLIDGERNQLRDFILAVERLLELLDGGETILVHCGAGVSRSCAVTATALAYDRKKTVEEAITRIEQRKPDVNPHPALVKQAHQTLPKLDRPHR